MNFSYLDSFDNDSQGKRICALRNQIEKLEERRALFCSTEEDRAETDRKIQSLQQRLSAEVQDRG